MKTMVHGQTSFWMLAVPKPSETSALGIMCKSPNAKSEDTLTHISSPHLTRKMESLNGSRNGGMMRKASERSARTRRSAHSGLASKLFAQAWANNTKLRELKMQGQHRATSQNISLNLRYSITHGLKAGSEFNTRKAFPSRTSERLRRLCFSRRRIGTNLLRLLLS